MKLKIKIIFLIVLIAASSVSSVLVYKSIKEPKKTVTEALVKEKIENCANLTTIKYEYQDIVTIKKSAAFGLIKGYSAVRYSAVARIGVPDISKVEASIFADTITIKVPKSILLDNTIQSMEQFDEMSSCFVSVNIGEMLPMINESKDTVSKSIKIENLKKEADERNKILFSSMFNNLGYSVKVETFLKKKILYHW